MVAEAEGGAGATAVAGREEGVVDAGRHDLDAGRIGAVELDELGDLVGAVGEDGVGAGDDLGLGVDAAVGLGVAGLGLHPGEGVEGRHQRERELVLEPMAGQARQPVVGVDGVGAALAAQVAGHAVGELVDDLGELFLGQVGRTGLHVHDPEAGLDVDHLGEVVGPAPHVDLGAHAGLGQRGDQLAHVHVHAAGVAAARLGQGGRVQRQHGERSHDATTLRAARAHRHPERLDDRIRVSRRHRGRHQPARPRG